MDKNLEHPDERMEGVDPDTVVREHWERYGSICSL